MVSRRGTVRAHRCGGRDAVADEDCPNRTLRGCHRRKGFLMNGVQESRSAGRAVSVEVEVEIAGGLFSISIVGLPDAAVRESKNGCARRSAFGDGGQGARRGQSGACGPSEGGRGPRLPIAIGIASAMGSLPSLPRAFFWRTCSRRSTAGVRGAVGAALLARDSGVPLFAPAENAGRYRWSRGARPTRRDLADLFAFFRGELELASVPEYAPGKRSSAPSPTSPIYGGSRSATGFGDRGGGAPQHTVIGSPGSGKTLLARALRGILPPLSHEELLETTLVRSTLACPSNRGCSRRFVPCTIRRARSPSAAEVRTCVRARSVSLTEACSSSTNFPSSGATSSKTSPAARGRRDHREQGDGVGALPLQGAALRARIRARAAGTEIPRSGASALTWNGALSPKDLRSHPRQIDLHVPCRASSPKSLSRWRARRREQRGRGGSCPSARTMQRERWAPHGFSCNAELPERIVKRSLGLSSDVRPFLSSMAGRLRLSGRE